jgi:uncharacterized membrane protein YagU involved in acid resistance
MQERSRQVLTAIILGGVIAATLDIGAASLIAGRNPTRIMQAIAGGLLGKATFDGGIATMILGTVLQEIMGMLIAAIYVAASRIVPGSRRRWISSGLVYGVIVYFVMNYVVLPLSAWKSAPHFPAVSKFAADMAAMLLFGLIVAFFARRLVSEQRAQGAAASPA